MRTKNKIGIISCEDSPLWGGENGICNYITSRLKEVSSNTEFVHYHAITGSLPNQKELLDFAGFVISGSHYSVNDGFHWISNLIEFVKLLREQDEGPKLFGICFGHQLIAKAFGGRVEKNSSGEFVWGTEKVEVFKPLQEKTQYQKCLGKQKAHFNILHSHGEWVSVLPVGACCLAKSRTCPCEVLSYGDKIMSTQGHPELTEEALVDNILPRLRQKRILSEVVIKKAKEAIKNEDQQSLMKFVFMFLSSK